MVNETYKQAIKLALRNYTVAVFEDKQSNGTKIFMAKNPELNGCMAQGITIDEAIQNLSDARIDYIYDSLVSGIAIPEPASITSDTVFLSNPDQIIINRTFLFTHKTEELSHTTKSRQIYEAQITI